MIWLLLSILCSTLIFVNFKLFDRFKVSNLQAIVINYFIAFGVGLYTGGFEMEGMAIMDKPWFYSIVLLGFLFIFLFQLMAVVSQKFGIAAVSVTVKMSLVIPVTFAIWYYSEGLSVLKLLGIIAALIAVYLATRKPIKTKAHPLYFLLPLVLFAGSGFLDAFLKYNQQELVPPAEHSYFASLIFLTAGILGVLMLIIRLIQKKEELHWRNLIGGVTLGIPNYGSIYFLLLALEVKSLESSVVFPINNVGIVALSVITGWLLFNEKLSRINKIGIILALVAILLIAYERIF